MWFLLCLMFVHFISDFVLQTHYQASNKSKCNRALAAHVTTYSLTMASGFALLTIMFEVYLGESFRMWVASLLLFFCITYATHFATDYVTSRITTKLYNKKDWHNFFVVVGFDQLIHYATLFATVFLIGRMQ